MYKALHSLLTTDDPSKFKALL